MSWRSRSPRTRPGRSPTRSASARSPAKPARSRGSTRCTTPRTSRSTCTRSAATCCSARRTSSAGRISGSRTCARELAETWRPVQGAPVGELAVGRSFETGTLPYELLAGFSATIAYLETLGGMAVLRDYERELGEHLVANLPENVTLYGPPTMDGRVPTFLFNVDGVPADEVARTASASGASASGRPTTGTASRSRERLPRAVAARRDHPLQHARRGRPAAQRARIVRRVSDRTRNLVRTNQVLALRPLREARSAIR